MINVSYYKQTPIMKRVLEYIGDSVYVKGSNPEPEAFPKFRRYNDVIEAMGHGLDLFRSLIDFSDLLFEIDLEYGNQSFPGEIFHKQIESFGKLEPVRYGIRDFLDSNSIDYLELMTGRGYNFVAGMKRDSPSYNALMDIGKRLRSLPISAIGKLIEKEQLYGNVPLVKDSFAFQALGRICDYIFDVLREDEKIPLLLRTSDFFDENEIAIFDTTSFGYLINRRSKRCAFSLHQKSRKSQVYNYYGPPIVTIPTKGISLEDRLKIRSDERDNYAKAVNLAKEVSCEIPHTEMSRLITSYFFSDTYQKHLKHGEELGIGYVEDKKTENTVEKLLEIDPSISVKNVLWDIKKDPPWHKLEKIGLSEESHNTLQFPNDMLLRPMELRNLIKELTYKGIERKDIISMIANKYNSDYGWSTDLTKNDAIVRAEYWVRTLSEQL